MTDRAAQHAAEDAAYARTLSTDDIEEMLFDGDVIAADGCQVDPDGRCPHGYRSPLLTIGLI